MFMQKIFTILYDIRYWIVAFFLLRLFHITTIPLEIEHTWRQLYTLSIARNFYEGGIEWFYPRVNHTGWKSEGIAGAEFPFFNVLICLFSYLSSSFEGWYGRLINLTVSSVGIYYYYQILRKYINPLYENRTSKSQSEENSYGNIAFFATMILLTSIWFSYSRKIMPDTFSVSLVIIGAYYGLNFLYESTKKSLNIGLYILFCGLGVLCKMPAVALLAIFIVPVLDKNVALRQKTIFAAASFIVMGLLYSWYFAWVPYLVETYGNPLFFPTGLKQGAMEVWAERTKTAQRFTETALYSNIAVILAAIGCLLMFIQRKRAVIIASVAMLVPFILYILKTGNVFSTHTYYIIPIVPLLAFWAGSVLTSAQHWLPSKFHWVCLILSVGMAAQAVNNQWSDLYCFPQYAHRVQLEELVNRFCPDKNEPVFVSDIHSLSPCNTYFARRNAWPISQEQINDQGFIRGLKGWPPQYFFFDKINNTGEIPYESVYEDGYYRVYKTNYRTHEN